MFQTNPSEQPNGFQLTFDNGYSISVQWGRGNYCSNRYREPIFASHSDTAEVAIWDKNNNWIRFPETHELSQDVVGWQTAEDVAAIIFRVASLSPLS